MGLQRISSALKRIDYIGVTFRTRSIEEVREINRGMRADPFGFEYHLQLIILRSLVRVQMAQ